MSMVRRGVHAIVNRIYVVLFAKAMKLQAIITIVTIAEMYVQKIIS